MKFSNELTRTAKSKFIPLFFLVAIGVAGTTQATTVTINPFPTTLSVGDTFNIDYVASGFSSSGGPSLSDFGIGFSFSSGIIAATGVTFGTALGGGGTQSVQTTVLTPSASPAPTRSVVLSEVSLLTDSALDLVQPASFLLASITFEAIGVGSTGFQLIAQKVGDPEINFFHMTGTGVHLKPVRLDLLRVTVTQVPEPASLVLLSLALVGFGFNRRKER